MAFTKYEFENENSPRGLLLAKATEQPSTRVQEPNGHLPWTEQGGDIGYLGRFQGVTGEAAGRLSPI